jgi:hypothetical protein
MLSNARAEDDGPSFEAPTDRQASDLQVPRQVAQSENYCSQTQEGPHSQECLTARSDSNDTGLGDISYFKGFKHSAKFERHFRRLEALERWRELAVRPSPEDCHPDEQSLLYKDIDDCVELGRRCDHVRTLMNDNLPRIQEALDEELVAKTSAIPDAGLGLFYEPARQDKPIPAGTILCYYTGHMHNFQSARKLQFRNYLMNTQGDVLVDPRLLPHIKARYINDPLNEDMINCRFVPEEFRAAVVATREIRPGQELFASYGNAYWSQHESLGRILKV